MPQNILMATNLGGWGCWETRNCWTVILPTVALETKMGEICLVAAGTDEGVQLCCCTCTMVFLLSGYMT